MLSTESCSYVAAIEIPIIKAMALEISITPHGLEPGCTTLGYFRKLCILQLL